MSFKDQLRRDLDVFINVDEFGNTHIINGQKVPCVIDSSVAQRFDSATVSGVFRSTIVVFLRQGDLDPLPQVDSSVILDGAPYRCFDVNTEQGIDALTLVASEQ